MSPGRPGNEVPGPGEEDAKIKKNKSKRTKIKRTVDRLENRDNNTGKGPQDVNETPRKFPRDKPHAHAKGRTEDKAVRRRLMRRPAQSGKKGGRR